MGGICCCLKKNVENDDTETRNNDAQISVIQEPRNSFHIQRYHGNLPGNANVNRGVWNPKNYNNSSQEITSIVHGTKHLNIEGKYDPKYFPVLLGLHSFFNSSIYQIFPIHENEDQYWDIKRRITNRHFKVLSIDKIKNEYLEKSYLLKRKQKLKHYPYLEELELFHGTKSRYADSICKNNFNWRFSGNEVGHKFGQGVCFSCNAMYAANYSDADNDEKVMFIAKVLIGKRCLGKFNMKLPVAGCDTSTKQSDNIVVVKYEDNEFYPIYRIKFLISPGYVLMKQRNKNLTRQNLYLRLRE